MVKKISYAVNIAKSTYLKKDTKKVESVTDTYKNTMQNIEIKKSHPKKSSRKKKKPLLKIYIWYFVNFYIFFQHICFIEFSALIQLLYFSVYPFHLTRNT